MQVATDDSVEESGTDVLSKANTEVLVATITAASQLRPIPNACNTPAQVVLVALVASQIDLY